MEANRVGAESVIPATEAMEKFSIEKVTFQNITKIRLRNHTSTDSDDRT